MIVGALVLLLTMRGMTEASTTRSPGMLCTRIGHLYRVRMVMQVLTHAGQVSQHLDAQALRDDFRAGHERSACGTED